MPTGRNRIHHRMRTWRPQRESSSFLSQLVQIQFLAMAIIHSRAETSWETAYHALQSRKWLLSKEARTSLVLTSKFSVSFHLSHHAYHAVTHTTIVIQPIISGRTLTLPPVSITWATLSRALLVLMESTWDRVTACHGLKWASDQSRPFSNTSKLTRLPSAMGSTSHPELGLETLPYSYLHNRERTSLFYRSPTRASSGTQ